MRILVASMPSTGHIHPIVPLMAGMQRAGHQLAWATGPEACSSVERYGFATIPLRPTPRSSPAAPAPEVRDLPPRERRQAFFGKRFGAAAAHVRPALAQIVDHWKPALIVHDTAEFAAAPVAHARGLPHVTVAFSGALPQALVQSIVNETAEMWNAEGLDVPADAGLYEHLYLHPFPPSLGSAPASTRAAPLRPMGFDGADAEDVPAWVASLGIDRPAIYATLGTVVSNTAAWRALFEALDSLDVDAIATIGSKIDRHDLGTLPANVRVEPYVPQSFLLDHVAVVASHAGAGTMLAAAAHARPQLCVPMGADQWANADALTGSGAGITLEEDRRDAASIRAGLHSLLTDPAFSTAAARVAMEIRALPQPDDYLERLETLAAA